jgi:sporulation protein YlmC with PRC-barrel domain
MSGAPTELREKLVLDWNNFAVGKIRDAHVDPKTKTVRSLVISLSDEARVRLGSPGPSMVIPIDYVFGIRRGEVTLDRSFEEIRRMGPEMALPSR